MSAKTVKVSNLSLKASQRDVREFFSFSGDIVYVEVQSDGESSQNAFVTFTDSQGAETAVLLSGATIVDSTVTVTLAPEYQLPPEATSALAPRGGSNPNEGESVIRKAEDVVSSMFAKGFVLGKDALSKAKSFDEKHSLTSTASAKIKTIEEEDGISWRTRIIYPTILGGIVGGGIGTLSKHREVHGLAKMSATYATNLAIVTGCYCGAREIVRASRHSEPDDLFDSAIAGFGTGAILGRLQGGPAGAVRYSIGIAIVGTGIDYAAIKLRPVFKSMYESVAADEKKNSWFKWPEWFPIQVLDEEALAAKRAREESLRARIRDLTKEES